MISTPQNKLYRFKFQGPQKIFAQQIDKDTERAFAVLFLPSLLLLASLVLLASLLLLAHLLMSVCLMLLAFLLLLAAAWFPTFIGVPAVAFIPNVDGAFAVAIASLPILASLSYCSWYLYVLYYTMRHIKAIELSDYLISEWQFRETIGLSDFGSRPQSIKLSDIGLTKNYWLPTSHY